MSKRESLGASVVPFLVALTLAGCGSSPISDKDSSKQAQNGSPAAPATQPTTTPPSVPSDDTGARSPDLEGFGVIREFGGNDTAAMFGLLPASGTLKITSCTGPNFLVEVGCRVGQLDGAAMDRLFLKSSKPMAQSEKQSLLSQWSGAQVIYLEGYNGALCTVAEIEYNITVSGTANGHSFTSTFQFIALPNSNGDCTYHKFGTITRT
ncbi:MAG: hypothetical protein NDJ90_07115 [Oligoflexia bacterium]|nr:hypothetical protein [Oligoflexia bacterium]